MNSLVAYGDESDEDASPRRRQSLEGINPLKNTATTEAPAEQSVSPDDSSSQSRQRKDSDFFYDEEPMETNEDPDNDDDDDDTNDGFAEPPPPPGHRMDDSPSEDSPMPPNMTKVSSTASLSALERDTFEREDARVAKEIREYHRDESAEPAPPIRQSMEDDEDEIDRQLEECKDLLTVGPSSEGGSTPRYDDSSKEEGPSTPLAVTQDEPDNDDQIVCLPPAPEGIADQEVERRFEIMFEKKAMGHNLNRALQSRKDFKNPSIYELFIEQHEIKEFGSNFPIAQYNPDGYPEECFYDYISEKQNKLYKAKEAHKAASNDAPVAKRPKN